MMSPQGWHQDFPDPSDYLESRFATKSIADEEGSNYAFYSNAHVDSLLARAKGELDAAVRTSLYVEVERILCDEAPWAFEYASRSFQIRQPYVRGYQMHAVWTSDVIPIWLDRAPTPGTQARSEAPLSRELVGSLIGGAR